MAPSSVSSSIDRGGASDIVRLSPPQIAVIVVAVVLALAYTPLWLLLLLLLLVI